MKWEVLPNMWSHEVETAGGEHITFLDTPATKPLPQCVPEVQNDIAVIVIAADDAIMPQTREAISHAQAADKCHDICHQ